MFRYTLADEMLTAVSFEFDSEEVLFGLTSEVNLSMNGQHAVFPYSTGGSGVSTFSSVRSSPGTVRYSGILLGDTDLLRRVVFEKLGVMTSSVRMKLMLPETGEILAHLSLSDFRIGAIGLASTIVGHTTMIRGQVSATFRRAFLLAV